MTRDRRLPALVALGAFLLLTVIATVLRGAQPAGEAGGLPAVVQYAGYACALVGALLLRTAGERGLACVLLVALAVLLALDLAIAEGSPNIGGGLARLVALVAVLLVAVGLTATVRENRRR